MLKVVKTVMAASLVAVTCMALTACGDDGSSNKASDQLLDKKFTEVTKINGKTFGTFFYITVPGGYPGGEDALKRDADFVFKKVSDAISTFDPSSEIARFDAARNTNDFPISDYLAGILEEVHRQALRIDGAMDPTVGPLVNLWGFGPTGEVNKSPSDATIAEIEKYVGLDKYSLRRAATGTAYLVKVDPRVELDLSTIGEGLAADELATVMDMKGVDNYMIAVAGAIRTKGANPDGKLWRVGIEDPLSQGQKVFAAVCPQGMAISTAGSYRNFFMDKDSGKFYSHIIDPKTGKPISHRTLSVSVVDRQALVTDALDTGLLVMGAKAAVDWGNKNDVAVYAIEVDDKGNQHATYSRPFEQYLKCTVLPNGPVVRSVESPATDAEKTDTNNSSAAAVVNNS